MCSLKYLGLASCGTTQDDQFNILSPDSRPASRLRQAGTCAAISSMGISLPHALHRSAVGASKRDSRLSAAASKRETSCGGAAAAAPSRPAASLVACSHKASAAAPPLTPSRWRGVINPPMSACCAESRALPRFYPLSSWLSGYRCLGAFAAAPAPRTAGPTDGHMGDKPWLQPIPRAADGGGAGGGDVRCPEKIPFVRDLSTRKAASLFRPSLPLRPCSWPLGG